MRSTFAALLTAGTLFGTAGAALAQEGNAEAGQRVFAQCRACHQVGPTARNGVGPILNGVVGRQAGTLDGYNYSPLNKNAGMAGLTWTPENLVAYLPNPNDFLKKYLTDNGKADQATGATKMTFRLQNPQQVADVVAYLRTLSQ